MKNNGNDKIVLFGSALFLLISTLGTLTLRHMYRGKRQCRWGVVTLNE